MRFCFSLVVVFMRDTRSVVQTRTNYRNSVCLSVLSVCLSVTTRYRRQVQVR